MDIVINPTEASGRGTNPMKKKGVIDFHLTIGTAKVEIQEGIGTNTFTLRMLEPEGGELVVTPGPVGDMMLILECNEWKGE